MGFLLSGPDGLGWVLAVLAGGARSVFLAEPSASILSLHSFLLSFIIFNLTSYS